MSIRNTTEQLIRIMQTALSDRNTPGRGRSTKGFFAHVQPDKKRAYLKSRVRETIFEKFRLPLDVRHLAGPERISYTDDELIVVCLVRNGQPWLPAFIDHYQHLGVKHIIFLDNSSTDSTVTIAARYPDVSIFRTQLPFKDNNDAMRRYLVHRFGGPNRWVLCVDIDEFFDYPNSKHLKLKDFLGYLRHHDYTAIVAYMLDLFPAQLDAQTQERHDIQKTHCFYDLSSITKCNYYDFEDPHTGKKRMMHNVLSNPHMHGYQGGIRGQLFGLKTLQLIKHPLMRLDGKLRPVEDAHTVDYARVADISGVLYHYKFTGNFAKRVKEAVNLQNYAGNSYEYKHYHEVLQQHPNLLLKTNTTRQLHHVSQLVDEGFLHVTNDYRSWVSIKNKSKNR